MHNVDFIEQGEGETVILLHSTAAGNKQWRKLIDTLSPKFRVVAPNLYGYGNTTAWSVTKTQTLADQAALIDQFVHNQNDITIIGHSFGGSVAMMAALRHRDRVRRLILIEPNPFYLLAEQSQSAGYREAANLCNVIKQNGDLGSWEIAAEYFADYWNGEGSWHAMDELRQTKFVAALKPNYHEWDCVMNENTSINTWEAKLPKNTSLLFSENTVTSILELQALFQSNIPQWQYHKYVEGGHMAPLTHPHIINPLIEEILTSVPEKGNTR